MKNTFSKQKGHTPYDKSKDLRAIFIIIPTEKAINNDTFICERFYAKVLVKEFRL